MIASASILFSTFLSPPRIKCVCIPETLTCGKASPNDRTVVHRRSCPSSARSAPPGAQGCLRSRVELSCDSCDRLGGSVGRWRALRGDLMSACGGHQRRLPAHLRPLSLRPVLTAPCLLSGSLEERGFLAWNEAQGSEDSTRVLEIYGLPCGIGTKCCTSSCTRFLPFWPRQELSGKGEMGVSQLTLCSQDFSGERPEGAIETRM